MAFVVPNVLVAGQPVDPAALNTNFNAIATKINGQVGNTEWNTADPLQVTNLAQPNYHHQAMLRFRNSPAGWPASGGQLLDYVTVPGQASPAWSPTAVVWICNDIGTGDAQFQVVWGFYNTGVWTTTMNITAATTIATGGGAGSILGNQGTGSTVFTNALTYPNTYMALGLISASPAKTTVCANYDLVVVVDLKTNLSA